MENGNYQLHVGEEGKLFAVVCPQCKKLDIIEARKRMVSVQAQCRHCHKNTWLKFIGQIVHFGEHKEYTKVEYF